VGSLAVALAAQKTLENIIGAVTLYTARPVSAGDFCRFGNITGTVEEIGLRSTIIRTLDRSQVVIPNSVFAAQEIENFSHRDRIRYLRRFRLQRVSAEQLRFIPAELRKVFLAHPKLIQDTVNIRFENIDDANAILRLDSGVDTTDYQEFLGVMENLNLSVVETVLNIGAVFSGPGRFVQLEELKPGSPEHSAQIEKTLQQWREQDKLPSGIQSNRDVHSSESSNIAETQSITAIPSTSRSVLPSRKVCELPSATKLRKRSGCAASTSAISRINSGSQVGPSTSKKKLAITESCL
jgi:MscS family membrane protein